jgi:phosphate starvation-inducible membrane PsiE
MDADSPRGFEATIDKFGDILVRAFHLVALFVFGGSVVWSAVVSYVEVMRQGHAHLHDLLLLFIYLELGAMVGIYFRTHRLPVRFLVYIAITALTRFLTVDLKELSSTDVLIFSGAILMLAISGVVLQFGAARFGGSDRDE